MILDIIKYGEKDYGKLRIKNVDVKKENPFLQKLIDDMFDTLDFHKSGVGLAAPQVGHNLNFFIVKYPYRNEEHIFDTSKSTTEFREVFINPEIYLEGLHIQVKEGCLSFPSLEFPVNRRSKIQIKYFDRNWVLRIATHEEMLAIIIQHEYDHLKGKLIID